VNYDADDPRARIEREREAGGMPGAAAPQPFAPLVAPPLELDPLSVFCWKAM